MRNRSLRATIPGDPPGTALTLMLLGTSLCLSVGQVTTGPVAAAATAQATPAPSIRGLKLGAPSVANGLTLDVLDVATDVACRIRWPCTARQERPR